MSKRSKVLIIKSLYKIISDGKPHSFNEIATEIGTSWETIKNWAEILEYVQDQPKIKLIRNKVNLIILADTSPK